LGTYTLLIPALFPKVFLFAFHTRYRGAIHPGWVA
jgi:hypothetical protein